MINCTMIYHAHNLHHNVIDRNRPVSTVVDIGRPWPPLVDICRQLSTLIDICRPLSTCADIGRPWYAAVGTDRPWSTLVDRCRHCQTLPATPLYVSQFPKGLDTIIWKTVPNSGHRWYEPTYHHYSVKHRYSDIARIDATDWQHVMLRRYYYYC